MTKDKALKMARDALIQAHYVIEHHQDVTKREQAINAIEEALVQPTSGDYAMGYAEGFNDACKPMAQSKQAPNDNGITVDLLERLKATLTRLGYATPEGGLEQFGACLPTQLYNLCRAVDGLLKEALAQPEQETGLPSLKDLKRSIRHRAKTEGYPCYFCGIHLAITDV